MRGLARRMVLTAVALVAAAVSACATASSPADDIKASEISPSLGVNFADYTRTPEGLFYKDVVVAEGAVAGDRSKVTVAYRDGKPVAATQIVVSHQHVD